MKQKSKRRKSVKVVNENEDKDGVTDGVTDSVTDGVTKGLKIQISAAEKKLADLVLKKCDIGEIKVAKTTEVDAKEQPQEQQQMRTPSREKSRKFEDKKVDKSSIKNDSCTKTRSPRKSKSIQDLPKEVAAPLLSDNVVTPQSTRDIAKVTPVPEKSKRPRGRPRKHPLVLDQTENVSNVDDHVQVDDGPEERVRLEDGELRQLRDVVVLEDPAIQTSVKSDDQCQKKNSNQQIQSKSENLPSPQTLRMKRDYLDTSNERKIEDSMTVTDQPDCDSNVDVNDCSHTSIDINLSPSNSIERNETLGLPQTDNLRVQNDVTATILRAFDDEDDFSLYLSDSDENDEQANKSSDLKDQNGQASVTSVSVPIENLKVEINHNSSQDEEQIVDHTFADQDDQQTNQTIKKEGASNFETLENPENVETGNLISPTSAAKSTKRDRLVQNEVAKQKYNFRSKLTIPRKYRSDDEDDIDKIELKISKPEKLLKIAQPLTTTEQQQKPQRQQQLNPLDLEAEDYEELEIISSETEMEERLSCTDEMTSVSSRTSKSETVYDCEKDISDEKIILKIKKKKKKKNRNKEDSIRIKKKKSSKDRDKTHNKDGLNLDPSTSFNVADDLRVAISSNEDDNSVSSDHSYARSPIRLKFIRDNGQHQVHREHRRDPVSGSPSNEVSTEIENSDYVSLSSLSGSPATNPDDSSAASPSPPTTELNSLTDQSGDETESVNPLNKSVHPDKIKFSRTIRKFKKYLNQDVEFPAPVECDDCDESFVSTKSYLEHTIQTHRMTIYQCSKCRFEADTACDLMYHFHSEHKVKEIGD